MKTISPRGGARRALPRAAAVAGALLLLAGAGADAQTARPLEPPRPAITEFRGFTFTWGLEDHIWRLGSDGRATMIYTLRRGLSERNGSMEEGGDTGTWSRQNGQLCVTWQQRRDISGCYTVVPMFGIHVRLVGRYVFEGTIE
jgi:hypothetical protein